jgi:hypothetical protein
MPVRIRSQMDWMRPLPVTTRNGFAATAAAHHLPTKAAVCGRAFVLTAERHADDARNRTAASLECRVD